MYLPGVVSSSQVNVESHGKHEGGFTLKFMQCEFGHRFPNAYIFPSIK